jgi:hypothetical protein
MASCARVVRASARGVTVSARGSRGTRAKGSRRGVTHRTRASEGSAEDDDDGSIQLGTAKLPVGVNESALCDGLYQWASTLTSSGQNLPFALSQRVDRIEDGFELTFLTSTPGATSGELSAVGAIVASVEDAPGGNQGRVLMIRGYGNVAKCVDTPVVMNSMPAAIRRAVAVASQ